MSKYGLKIKNIQAGSLYGYILGIRDHYDYTDAMFTNSLFSNFLMEEKLLSVWKEESTRDIICIDFGYGTRSYEEDLNHIESLISKTEDLEKIQKLKEVKSNIQSNEKKYEKLTKEQLRDKFYVEGVNVKYVTKNKKGVIKSEETIHYKMLYRTPGKAKKGSCMFINEKIYDKAISFLRMGIELPKDNSPIVEIGAYSSLITSSIVDTVKIEPKNIFVIKDVDSFFKTNVINIKTNKDKHCIAETTEEYTLKNTLFDGQALIDSSIFPEKGNGYILLRHHFCKMAAFNTNIQEFFKDYYGDDYDVATVTDMFNNEHYVKDIKLITTDNAMKWLKFNVSYEYWLNYVEKNGSLFGIVKTAHKSKLEDVQRMSYQMVNSLDMSIMENVVKTSKDYIEDLKKNDDKFLDYLRKNKNFSNDFEVLVALCEHNSEFTRSEYFRRRKRKIIENYLLDVKSGHIIQNADNLVIVGSPYAMLLHSVGENIEKDDTFSFEQDTIQCYSERFSDGEYLAEFRSPFNSKNNMGYLHNTHNKKLQKYFNFGEQIIAINMIGTDFQDRNNGLIYWLGSIEM